jgi:hypothetical protein
MPKKSPFTVVSAAALLIAAGSPSWADVSKGNASHAVSGSVIDSQRAALKQAALAANAGPQSPRDLAGQLGGNPIMFSTAPSRAVMNLCNIHLHESAEHRGGEFTTYVGNGDGSGYGTGYRYNGALSADELKPISEKVGSTKHGQLLPGSTIEVHFVYSTAHVKPGPTLASCLSKENVNPQLRVEAVVAVLVNDRKAADFVEMTKLTLANGYSSAPNIPDGLGRPVVYSGSTTGPSYNLSPSPLQVTWNVRPKVVKVDILSVGAWLRANPFNEDHAHGVRNLVMDPALLSKIQQAD